MSLFAASLPSAVSASSATAATVTGVVAPTTGVVAPASAGVVAQAGTSPLAIGGTVGLLALFLSLTAHLAARNVLGDVPAAAALGVGIGPAIVSVATQLLSIHGGVGVAVALVVDGMAIHLLYGEPRRTSAYITAIHVIVTVILGSVLGGLVILLASVPG
ncbi:MAG: DUF7473 family protein [Natrialbaceae archaeon]